MSWKKFSEHDAKTLRGDNCSTDLLPWIKKSLGLVFSGECECPLMVQCTCWIPGSLQRCTDPFTSLLLYPQANMRHLQHKYPRASSCSEVVSLYLFPIFASALCSWPVNLLPLLQSEVIQNLVPTRS